MGEVIGFSHTQGLDPQASTDAWPTLRAEGGGHAVVYMHSRRSGDTTSDVGISPTLLAAMGTGGGNIPMLNDGELIAFSQNQRDEVRDLRGVSATVTTSASHKNGTFLAIGEREGMLVRRLTPVECERLQGFPDGHTEGQAETHRYKQMGNAVAVPVVSWIVAGITGADA